MREIQIQLTWILREHNLVVYCAYSTGLSKVYNLVNEKDATLLVLWSRYEQLETDKLPWDRYSSCGYLISSPQACTDRDS